MSPKQARGRRRKSAQRSRRRSILVVDDEVGTVEVLLAVLKDAGFDALGVLNGRDALAKLADTQIDLVVLDFVMPTLDGSQTLRAMRNDPRHAEISVVLMSGIPESMVKRKCRNYSGFLRKPFSLDELLATIDAALKRS
jgi:DNA-binding response OmpR family regulator